MTQVHGSNARPERGALVTHRASARAAGNSATLGTMRTTPCQPLGDLHGESESALSPIGPEHLLVQSPGDQFMPQARDRSEHFVEHLPARLEPRFGGGKLSPPIGGIERQTVTADRDDQPCEPTAGIRILERLDRKIVGRPTRVCPRPAPQHRVGPRQG